MGVESFVFELEATALSGEYEKRFEDGRMGGDEGRVWRLKEDCTGEEGAYISESWDSSDGEAKADRRGRTLSHWCWVVSSVD